MFLLLACFAIFLAGVARYWVSYDPRISVPQVKEAYREPYLLAHNLNENGAFANPFRSLPTGSSAHVSPVFPAYMAALMRVFGEKSLGAYAIQWAAALVLALQLALYPVFSKILGMGQLNGFIGAAIWIAAKPPLISGWEALYVALLLAAGCCYYRRYLDALEPARHKIAWLLGALMGFLIFISQAAAPVYASWLAWDLWRNKIALFTKSFLPLVLLPAAIIAPWTIRNLRVFHSFVLVRDNFGFELSTSNNDCAQYGFDTNVQSGCFKQRDPYWSAAEARKVIALGEVGYNKTQLHTALNWIAGHPSRFIKLTAERFVAYWMPMETFTLPRTGGGRTERATIYLMTLLSVPGLIMLFRRDLKSAATLASCLVLFPLIYYIVQFVPRYRYPILWITFLLGAMPITACVRKLWKWLSAQLWIGNEMLRPSPEHQ